MNFNFLFSDVSPFAILPTLYESESLNQKKSEQETENPAPLREGNVMRKVKVGDKIKIVNRIFSNDPYENGDILTVKKVFPEGAVYVEEHHNIPIFPLEFIVVDERPSVKVGDKIRIVRASGSCGYYTNGDEFTVRSLSPMSPGSVYVENIPIVINSTEYEVIERVEEKGANDRESGDREREIKVGDKVKVVNAENSAGYYENGDILTVDRIDYDGDLYVKEHPMIIYRWEVEPYKEGEEKAEDAEQKPQKSLADEIAEKISEILEMNLKNIEKQAEKVAKVAVILDEIDKKAEDIYFETSNDYIANMTVEIEYLVSELRSLLNIEERGC